MTSLIDARVSAMDVASDAAKVLHDTCLSGVQDEAFYVLDVGDVVRKHREWTAKMPRVQPFYAVKCNDDPTVLKVLANLGTGFDCASMCEIEKVLKLGVSPSRIVFANPTKTLKHVRHAARVGVDLMTFDNDFELRKIKDLYPTARLVLRIRCDAQISQHNLGDKFGCDAVKEAPRLLQLARDLELDIVGVSFHVGSGCGEPAVFRRAISAARVLFDLGKSLGYDMNLLDLGGGYPGNKDTSIDEIADVINLSLSDLFPSDHVTVIAEPGRYFVASAFTLATCVHSKREVLDEHTQQVAHVMYYIDDGVFGSFGDVVFYDDHPVPSTLDVPAGKLTPSSIWGPSCDGVDKIHGHILLPELQIGDWLVFENMGAYTMSVASNFNGFTVPTVHVVDSRSVSASGPQQMIINLSKWTTSADSARRG